MTAQQQIRPLNSGDFASASQTLQRAFFDDPLMKAIAPTTSARKRMRNSFYVSLRYGNFYGINTGIGDIDGVAIWIKPNNYKITPWRIIRTGMILMPFLIGIGPTIRSLIAFGEEERQHHIDAPMPHWYLFFLGVEPAQQGRGVGHRLITPMLDQADQERIPCYLETTNPKNLTFYKQHGFRVISEIKLLRNTIPCWTMLRDSP